MKVVPKSPEAGKLRHDAEALRAKLRDPAVTMSKTEVEETAASIEALEARANLLDRLTPADEIERQGGDAELRAMNPDSKDAAPEVLDFQGEMTRVAKKVRKHFGGPNAYVRALNQMFHKQALPADQMRVIEEVQALFKRTIVGTAADASGGEFLLPLEQVASIFSVDVAPPPVLEFATRYPMSGRSVRIPYVVQTDASGGRTRPMSGIANVSILAEGAQKPVREPTFAQRVVTGYKIAAFSQIGDETLADDFTGDLAPTVQKLIGGQVKNFLGELCTIDGTGTNEPLGALHANNGALLTVNRTTSVSITVDDVFAMYTRHTFGGGRSVWLVNRTAVPELLALTLNGNTLVTFLPNLQNAPAMQLLGIPVVVCDMLSTLGVAGDLALVNGGFYAYALRQALTVESSIHYAFRDDITSYRFITRGGGIPIPTGTYAYKASAGTKVAAHSPFVRLGDDATS